ncbi:MAG: hypothetical protein KF784_10950 [Fimbriimonadaceae bacterium]|nr:hypothetical protein [Fimbriimonadaceae bacterium]
MLKRSIGISFIGLMALSFAATTQDGVLLRRQLTEGTSDVYTVVSSMNSTLDIPGQGVTELKADMSSTYTVKIGKVDPEKGLADLETIMSDIKLKLEGPMSGGEDAAPPKDIVVVGKIDNLGRQSEMKMKGVTGEMLMVMGAATAAGESFFTFPEKAVKIGETWTVMTPKVPQFGNKEHKLTAKYVGDEVAFDKKAMKISLTGTIPMDVNVAEMMKQMGSEDPTGGMLDSMQPMMRGNIIVTGTALFEKATGKVLSIESAMDMKTRLEIPSAGMTLESPGKSKSSMKLKV